MSGSSVHRSLKRHFQLADLFEIVAAEVPDRLALSDETRDVTFAEMNHRADCLAAGLSALGLAAGDKIGLYLMNGPEYLESFFAAVKIGAVPFNVNYRYQEAELQYLFDNADAKAVIHHAEFSPQVAGLKSRLTELTVSIGVQTGTQGDIGLCQSADYESLILDHLPLADDIRARRREDDFILQYTGGTTGMPKGVIWPHKAFFYACLGGGGLFHADGAISQPEEQASRAAEGPALRIMPVAPLMHGAAIWTALSGLYGGITMVLDPMRQGFDADAIWQRVQDKQVNILQIVGDAMAIPLLNSLKANPGRWDLSRLVHLGSGGAVFSGHIKDGLRELLPNVMMGDGLGTSEGGISGMGEPTKDGGLMRLPADEHQQVIVTDRIAAIGETGYLARTGHTPVGYYNDPEKTAEIFRQIDGQLWVVTGDQARLDDDGMMTVFGRGSTCINSGGEKIYPEEVEETLRAHPAIHDAAVVGLPDQRWGQQVAAVISLSDNQQPPTLENVRSFCKTGLAGYKHPRKIVCVNEIKRSPAGKQDYAWAKSVLQSSDDK